MKAWDVQIAERTDGGFDLGLPDTYVPSKHDDKLTEVAEAVVGQLGWTFHSNPGKLTARIDPGDPPTFEPVLPYPFKTKVPGFDPTKPDWARLPLGEILGDAGAALDTITRHAAESGYAVELTDKQPSSGAYGYWQASTSKIVVWTGAADGDPAAIAHIAAHELGHAIDVTYLDDDERAQWSAARGRTGASWWVASGADDFASGAGDWAESFAWLQTGRGPWFSRVGPPPTASQLDLMRTFFP